MPQKTKRTPMMEQYFSIKEQYPDCLLFYRLGDFYELFYDDALEAARILEITLTSRNKNAEDPIPMCGVPHHSAKEYIRTLIEYGKKVAICEQLEDPKFTKGMVKRDVVQVLTPGTYTEYSQQHANNYLVALKPLSKDSYALGYVDVATGELKGTRVQSMEEVRSECSSLKTRELVKVGDFSSEALEEMCLYFDILQSTLQTEEIQKGSFDALLEDIEQEDVYEVLEGLLSYLAKTQKKSFTHLQKASYYERDFDLFMNYEAKRNLELTSTIRTQQKQGSLYWFLDETQTAMGARLLKQWIEKPLVLQTEIEERHDLVESLTQHYFERIDLLQLKQTLAKVPVFRAIADSLNHPKWQKLKQQLHAIPELYERIERAIDEDAPVSLSDGNIIKKGYHETLDLYRETMAHGKEWIAQLQQSEREATGIKSLKISYNKVFGYYIEVTKANLSQLDDSRYERKQTLSNAERFITPELKEKEALILEAEEKSSLLEYELFVAVREEVKTYTEQLQELAKAVATIDVLQSFSTVSEAYQLVRPTISLMDRSLEIIDGRHPVVEKVMGRSSYVPNSIQMTPEDHILLITGPNMSGKSTYMRQLALCVILSQIGCFVPATSAKIPIFTKIFTRIGAADDLISGQSTFMVEMMETNTALRQADPTSLLLFDEIGRGTATYDGMALAHAIIGYIHEHLSAKVLFSTHYHELTALSDTYEDLKNVHVGAIEKDGEVVFLHKIMEGPADKSYGIHVAKLAGLPSSLLSHAENILTILEKNSQAQVSLQENAEVERRVEDVESSATVQIPRVESEQLDLFTSNNDQEVLEEIKSVRVMNLTPLQALQFIDQWQTRLKG